ncbi:DUF6286 domain-containing protein [Actinomadura rupiterrae]|uniref:DUF6286 domain-containing protein n=1 Tax=Actinomadura rupiterrae TaxID=559627 RepID=UPI0020A5D728|nr:DUF6286 domain-containing protein [Actinomadura rupiterrae]MCP2334869.1 pterin-4a-carbinolamine dehydratase [Actinomadura rupiterrae]
MTTHAGRLPQAKTAARPATKGKKAARAARSAFRPRRIVTSLIAALALTAIGTITAIEVFSERAGHPAKIVSYGRVANWAEGHTWKNWAVLVVCGAVALVGLWFLLAGLLPGRPHVVPLRGDDPDLAMAITPGGLRSSLAAAAEDVAHSSDARVQLGRHRVTVSVHCPSHEVDKVTEKVKRSVETRLDDIRPLTKYKVSVKARTKKPT